VASAGPYASLHLTPDRKPHQHPTTLFFLQAGCPSCCPTNSVKALNLIISPLILITNHSQFTAYMYGPCNQYFVALAPPTIVPQCDHFCFALAFFRPFVCYGLRVFSPKFSIVTSQLLHQQIKHISNSIETWLHSAYRERRWADLVVFADEPRLKVTAQYRRCDSADQSPGQQHAKVIEMLQCHHRQPIRTLQCFKNTAKNQQTTVNEVVLHPQWFTTQ